MAQWMKNMVNDGKATTKMRKQYSTATQKRLSELKKATFHTLGSNKLHLLCQTPEGELKNDWIALHIMDFFNELSMLAEIATTHEDAEQYSMPGKGFPNGFIYKWREGKGKKAQSVSGPDYINYTIAYVETVLDDPSKFPDSDPPEYTEEFIPTCKMLYVKMFRVYAILYGAFLETLKKIEVKAHLNTSFKHFIYFSFAHNLTPKEKELTPLKAKVAEFRAEYNKGMKVDAGKIRSAFPKISTHEMEV